MTDSPFPAKPKPATLETIEALVEANPMPNRLEKQIGNWIEPQTMNCEADHADVMDCIAIAYPLIRARALATAERERPVRENPALAARIREGIAAAERGETVDRGSFAEHLDVGDEDE